jgi:hypothetical protein
MAIRFQEKSDLYVFAGYVLLVCAVAFNPFTVGWWQEVGLFPEVPSHFMHETDVTVLLPVWLDLLLLVCGVIMVRAPRGLKTYLNDSFPFNLFLFIVMLGILWSTNVILPGKFRVFRILYILLVFFILTNTLYQAVVKKREGKTIHPFYRNLGLLVYGLTMVLLLLEIVFMFFLSTHRFNGTLASRAWFLKHWELNAEGYRDAPMDTSRTSGKKNLLLLGDSFVAGHGIDKKKDRFGDRLQTRISDDWKVYNLGVGGSDVGDAFQRLKEFPVAPDLLVFSYYPNDIERDGVEGGLTIQRARSYNDIGLLPRFFVRRSYMLNYIYWMYPHPDELSDYLGFLKQCYSHAPAMAIHTAKLDSMVAFADSMHIPIAAVVFPLLEDVSGSGFATEPIVAHLQECGLPVLDVRKWVGDFPVEDMIVNRNDPHPSARLHALVADSLYEMLQRNGYLSAK